MRAAAKVAIYCGATCRSGPGAVVGILSATGRKSSKPSNILKGDLVLRPIYHKKKERIEAHIFVAFLAYCLHVTLAAALERPGPRTDRPLGAGEVGAMQMIDVHLPTTDGREDLDALHPTGTRAATPDEPTQVAIAGATTAPDCRRQPNPATPPVVKTFQPNPLVHNGRAMKNGSNPRSRASRRPNERPPATTMLPLPLSPRKRAAVVGHEDGSRRQG